MSRRPPVRRVLILAAVALTVGSAVASEMTAPDSVPVAETAINQRLVFESHAIVTDPTPTRTRRHRRRRPPAPTTPPPVPAPTTAAPTAAPVPPPVPAPPVPAPPVPAPPVGSGTAPSTEPNVGLPGGTALTPMGSLLITRPGTVIDGADIRGPVVVDAADVVIRRSRVSGDGDMGIYVRRGGLLLEDVTVDGFDNSIGGDNYTAIRVEVTRSGYDGFKIGSNVTIQDSWCHDLLVSAGAHSDCGQVQSGVQNVIIRRNWFDVSERGNSALFIAPDLGPSGVGPLVVENNVLGGGNFTLQCVDGDYGRYLIENITIRGNQFLSNSNYGPMRVNVLTLFLGNVYQGSLLPILL